jgi:biopolymer transport protein ExbD
VSAQTTSLLGYGMYFIDVLACLLFCITLALVGARFGREHTVAVDLPEIAKSDGRGGDVTGPSIVVRSTPDGVEILLDGVPVTLAALAAQLEGAPPPSVVVRSEESTLSQVIAVAHGAGVHDIRLAYEVARTGGDRP